MPQSRCDPLLQLRRPHRLVNCRHIARLTATAIMRTAEGTEQNHRHIAIRPAGRDGIQHVETVHARHFHVEEEKGKTAGSKKLDALDRGGGHKSTHLPALEQSSQDVSADDVVVHNQNLGAGYSRELRNWARKRSLVAL